MSASLPITRSSSLSDGDAFGVPPLTAVGSLYAGSLLDALNVGLGVILVDSKNCISWNC